MTRLIPSERFASGLLDIVERVVGVFGVNGQTNSDLRTTLYILLVIGMAFAAGCLVRWLCLVIVKRLLNRHFRELWQELSDNHVLRNIGRMIPPLVMFTLIPFAFNSEHKGTHRQQVAAGAADGPGRLCGCAPAGVQKQHTGSGERHRDGRQRHAACR